MTRTRRMREERQQLDRLHHTGNYTSSLNDYLRVSPWNAKFNAYEKLVKSGRWRGQSVLARLAVELAATAQDSKCADKLLLDATSHTAAAEQQAGNNPVRRLEAAMIRYNLPLHTAVLVEQVAPSIDLIEKAHRGTAAVLKQMGPSPKSLEKEQIPTYVGTSAEALALIMLQRYATENIGEPGWTPVPSLASQDRQDRGVSGKSGNWDTSIYCENDSPQNPTYKLQIKWGRQYREYDDSITVVSLDQDLMLNNRPYRLGQLFSEVVDYVSDTTSPYRTRSVERRTELLLDVIDQVEAA